MTTYEKNNYRILEPGMAANYVANAERRIGETELPNWLVAEIFSNIHGALENRARMGLYTDPTSREEVTGLVCAAMGGNDHVVKARREFNRYVVGLLQTNSIELRKVDKMMEGAK